MTDKEKIWTRKTIILNVVVPVIIAFVAGFFTGEDWKGNSLLRDAPEKTLVGARSLIGLVDELRVKITSNETNINITNMIDRIDVQARAVEANAELLSYENLPAQLDADFWLESGQGGTLGGTTPFGVTGTLGNGRTLIVNIGGESRIQIRVGKPLKYVDKNGTNCTVHYVNHVSHNGKKLYGFKTLCVNS